jgi:DNA-binding response OmpR family regulator
MPAHTVSAKHILVVDDEQHILDVVVYVLEQHGFEVSTAVDGEAALSHFSRDEPQLVVLDLGLPGMSGLDLFHELRKRRIGLPVIMLTSRSDEVDRVVGLELGADDYVTKPFSPRELAARVKNVLRRTGEEGKTQPDSRLALGPFEMDVEAFTLTYFGRAIELTRAEMLLIECLVRYPARVFTRDALIDRIYDGEHIVTDRSIDACVKRVRRKLAQTRADFDPIQTVYGMGYKLNPDCDAAP